MAYTVERTDRDEYLRDVLPNGDIVRVDIDLANIRYLIDKAKRNKSGRAIAGPVVVTIIRKRTLPTIPR